MKKEIKLNGRTMAFEASAMTDHMADHIFGINLSYAFQHTDADSDKLPDLIRKVAFVMNKRAELGGWRKVEELTIDNFYDWLDTIDSFALEAHAKEIMALYANNKKTTVSPKNQINLPAE